MTNDEKRDRVRTLNLWIEAALQRIADLDAGLMATPGQPATGDGYSWMMRSEIPKLDKQIIEYRAERTRLLAELEK